MLHSIGVHAGCANKTGAPGWSAVLRPNNWSSHHHHHNHQHNQAPWTPLSPKRSRICRDGRDLTSFKSKILDLYFIYMCRVWMDEKKIYIYISMYVNKKSFMYSLMNHIMNKKLRVSCICSFYHAKIHTETPHFTAKYKSRRMRLLLFDTAGIAALYQTLAVDHCAGKGWVAKAFGMTEARNVWMWNLQTDCANACSWRHPFADFFHSCLIWTGRWIMIGASIWLHDHKGVAMPEVTTPDGCDVTSDIGFSCFSYSLSWVLLTLAKQPHSLFCKSKILSSSSCKTKILSSLESKMSIL